MLESGLGVEDVAHLLMFDTKNKCLGLRGSTLINDRSLGATV